MSKHWFGVSRVLGWYPTSWEGWVVILGMATSVATTVFIVNSRSDSYFDTLFDVFPYVSLTIAFTIVVATIKGAKPVFGKSSKHKENFSPDNPKVYLLLPLLILPIIVYYTILQSYLGSAVLAVVFLLLLLVFKKISKN